MYKLIHNNMVVDLLNDNVCYVRYLPRQKRLVVTDSQTANGVMGSDKNTVYHLEGTVSTFDEEKTSVRVIEITQEEFNSLSEQFSIQAKENADLRNEVAEMKAQLASNNDLLAQILAKLS